MTTGQSIKKFIYSIWMFIQKLKGSKDKIIFNKENKKPLSSFYSLKSTLNNGNAFLFETLKGKKVLIVNTASDCLYTKQYDELEKLYELYKDKLIVLAFPANDFGEQEKADDSSIVQFCKINFGVSFPLMKKSVVIKNDNQNEVYKWLTNGNLNGWNNQQPKWNFSKYLIDENGILTHYFEPMLSPLSKVVRDIIIAD